MLNQQLLQIIQQNYNNKDNKLIINTSIFSNADINSLLTTWFNGVVTLSGVSAISTSDNGLISVSGKLSLLKLANQNCTISFGLLADNQLAQQGEPFMLVQLMPASSIANTWSLATLFPVLAGTTVDTLNFVQASIYLSSAKLALAEYPIIIDFGMNFYCQDVNTSNNNTKLMLNLVRSSKSLSLQGGISIAKSSTKDINALIPNISISSISRQVELAGMLTLPLAIALTTRKANNSDETDTQAYSNIGLQSQVKIDGNSIQLSGFFVGGDDFLVLSGEVSNKSMASLDSLNKFMLGKKLGQVFNGLFKLPLQLSLQKVSVSLSTYNLQKELTKALLSMSVSLNALESSTWTILPDLLALNNIQLKFVINSISVSPALSTSVSANAIIGKGDNSIALTTIGFFPDASFSLSNNAPFTLAKLGKILIPNNQQYPNITCDNLSLDVTPNAGPYSLTTDITSDWQIQVGLAQIKLQEAYLSLNYDNDENPATSGTLAAQAVIITNTETITTSANWQIPGDFKLQANLLAKQDDIISLNRLADMFAGISNITLPNGFPSVDFINPNLALTIRNSTDSSTIYDMAVQADIAFSNEDLQAVLELSKNGDEFAIVAGMWFNKGSWSPAALWPSIFGKLLKGIEFSDCGFVISTTDNPEVSIDSAPITIPSTITKGLTFFSSINISKSPLSILNKFYPTANALDFYGVIATNVAESKLVGEITGSSTTSNYGFSGLVFATDFASSNFSIQSGMTFSFHQIAGARKGQLESLMFTANGSIDVSAASLSIDFVLQGDSTNTKESTWVEPLGVHGLAINDFWGELSVDATGELSFGFGGDIIIGTGKQQASLSLDIVVEVMDSIPNVEVFNFSLKPTSSKSIALTTLIKQFTTLALDKIPLLNALTLTDFDLLLVANPTGWVNPATNVNYLPGFFSNGDINAYGYDIKFMIAVAFEEGIKANGSISKPIILANGLLSIADASGKKGPNALIDTSAIASSNKPYFTLSGSIKLLDISETLYAYATNQGFAFLVDLKASIFQEKLQCQLANNDFSGSATAKIGVDVSIPDLAVNKVTVIPKFTLNTNLQTKVAVSINPGLQLQLNGSFSWGSLTVSVNIPLVNIKKWDDLPALLIDYMQKYPEKIFADFLHDLTQWQQAVKAGLIKIGKDAAKVLKDAFKVAAKDAGTILADLGYTETEVANALETVWQETKASAAKAASDVKKFCAMSNANAALQPSSNVLDNILQTTQGKTLQSLYKQHQQELNELSSSNSELSNRINNILIKYQQDKCGKFLIIEDLLQLLFAIQRLANNDLQQACAVGIQLLQPIRTTTYQNFILDNLS